MRIDLRTFKIEKAASKNDRRPVLTNAYLDAENGVLVATDSVAMAIVPVELALDDTTGLVPVEALTLARKDQQKDTLADVAANGGISVRLRGERVEFERGEADDFPDWKKLFGRRKKPLATFALNPRLLTQVAEAIGAKHGVTIELYGMTEPLLVTPLGDDQRAKAIVMPLKAKAAEPA